MRKILVYKENGKVIKIEKIVSRDLAHLDSQQTFKHQVVADKTKYNRKKMNKPIDIQ
jgi:hypothetical protein